MLGRAHSAPLLTSALLWVSPAAHAALSKPNVILIRTDDQTSDTCRSYVSLSLSVIAQASGSVTDTASATTTSSDPDGSNDSASATTTVL